MSSAPAPTSFAVILAGGGGTRLWPASRRTRPKQLLSLGGDESLIGATFRRASAVFGAERTMVVTAADQADGVRRALPGLPAENLVVEPAPRNTAPAVGLAAVHVARRAGDAAVMAVMPSDAFVGDDAGFAAAVRTAVDSAADAIVTIGIKPTHAETGFGYLQRGRALGRDVFEAARFIEKPDAAKARTYLESGEHMWNSGMFFFSAGRLLAEARRHMPELGRILDEIRAAPDPEDAARRLYGDAPKVSIDYGIMEKASGIRVVPGDFRWNDVGSWAALETIRPTDDGGNVVAGAAIVRHTRGSVVVAEEGAPLVGVVGVEGLVVVATKDAVLVVPKERAQDVRAIVDALGAAGRSDLV